ncbi:MAG: GNAT family N-acetyltransferase [Thermodesulfobacteriota bacterium]
MIEIAVLTRENIDSAIKLWTRTEGLTLREADSPQALARYLERNPELSQAAWKDGRLIGAILAGHDGRRGYIFHLAVAREERGQGVGTALVERCLEALRAAGIDKCHLFVREENQAGRNFWTKRGWVERRDTFTMSRVLSDSENA